MSGVTWGDSEPRHHGHPWTAQLDNLLSSLYLNPTTVFDPQPSMKEFLGKILPDAFGRSRSSILSRLRRLKLIYYEPGVGYFDSTTEQRVL